MAHQDNVFEHRLLKNDNRHVFVNPSRVSKSMTKDKHRIRFGPIPTSVQSPKDVCVELIVLIYVCLQNVVFHTCPKEKVCQSVPFLMKTLISAEITPSTKVRES